MLHCSPVPRTAKAQRGKPYTIEKAQRGKAYIVVFSLGCNVYLVVFALGCNTYLVVLGHRLSYNKTETQRGKHYTLE